MLAETGEVRELSLRAVAREVDVATTSIYLHFRNLDELILAVKTRYIDEFDQALNAAADAAGEAQLSRARAHRYGAVRPGESRQILRPRRRWPQGSCHWCGP
jgi:AcrR family transcriptional regulator